jgi:peptide/nickel transport system substrate-binding protein
MIKRRIGHLGLLVIVPLLVCACGGSSKSTSTTQHPTSGGIATFAEAPGSTPNYIFPLTSGAYYTINTVSQFQYIMYRPLYWFFGTGKIALNLPLSLAKAPVYTNNDRTVTINLSGWKWSNGQVITSRDVEFWMNMVKANKSQWAAYAPGKFPDNIVDMKYPNSQTVVFTLNKSYNPTWFTGDELSQITPIPQAEWDKTSTNGPIGNYDRTPAGAVKVFNYLNAQSKMLSTYSTNPLWQIVDGAWRLKEFQSDGLVKMAPNPNYSGPNKPRLSTFEELPFTSGAAEFNVLRSGGVDYGYVPSEDVSQASYLKSHGYQVAPWIGWSINYIPLNMTNPTSGPIFKQLYFRQAFQHLVDQQGIVTHILQGYGYPDYGPVPVKPPNDLADRAEENNPYPYDPAAAKQLLTNNGWTVVPNGVSTCASPGSGAGHCGPGVAKGAKASFSFTYTSGQLALQQEAQILQGDLAQAGIKLNLGATPYNTVLSNTLPCTPGKACNWDIAYWGNGWVFAPYPTGEIMFASSGGYNVGGYSNATNDANIDATLTTSTPNAMANYEDFLAKDLPVIWFPVPTYQISAIKTSLGGTTPQDPGLTIDPASWYLTH